jgi:hypothetical protein
MDLLIRLKATGSPSEFAHKIGISQRMIFEYLSIMKSEGAFIEYSEISRTYYYLYEGTFIIGYQLKYLEENDKKSINGGYYLENKNFNHCDNIAVSFFKIAF